MSKRTDRDEMEATIEMLSRRLDHIRSDILRQGQGGDPRMLGLYKGELSEVIVELERYRVETAEAIAQAETSSAVSRAYLSVGKLTPVPSETAEILSFGKNKDRAHVSRRNSH